MATLTLLLMLLHLVEGSRLASERYHDYCVVGAGPAGLQLGYFLQRAGRDYVILERDSRPGSFFMKYPRHRQMNSFNKRYTGTSNKEFNLRHDWNSLLSQDDSLLFRHYSTDLFPHADAYVRYLQDFQQKLGIKVQFNTDIRGIRTVSDATAPDGHVFLMEDQRNSTYTCRTLVLATGISVPVIPEIRGIENAVGCEDLDTDMEKFEGKSVLILGLGNSAFEVASRLYRHTAMVHLTGLSRTRLAWATHYPGDIRAVNNEILDTYQLKSLDGIAEGTMSNTIFERFPDGRIGTTIVRKKEFLQYFLQRPVSTYLSYVHSKLYSFRGPYDVLVRCFGFKFDNSIFHSSSAITPTRLPGRREKYPAVRYDFRSVDSPGLFLAGAAAHSLDFRSSSGGFVHGFRYTARVLFRLLERRYGGQHWPSIRAPMTQLLSHVTKRLNEASGIFLMSRVLCDVIVINRNTTEFEHYQEVPVRLLSSLESSTGITGHEYLVLTVQRGLGASGADRDVFGEGRTQTQAHRAHRSSHLHPVLYHYTRLPAAGDWRRLAAGEALPRPDFLLHLVESPGTDWTLPVTHLLPLRRFLEHVTGHDLRNFYAETCFKMALTFTSFPPGCVSYLKGQGLSGTASLIQAAKTAGIYY